MITRRDLLSSSALAGLGLALAGCATATAPATTSTNTAPPTSATPATGVAATVATWLQKIADGINGVLWQLGLTSTKTTQLTTLLSQLSGIAQQIASGAGSGLVNLITQASPIVSMITSFLPGGSLVTAVMAAFSTAMSLAGVTAARTARFAAAAASMNPAQADAVLRVAASGVLPR